MEEKKGEEEFGMKSEWCWGGASLAQMGLGIWQVKKRDPGSATLMPFKAFGVATLFLGSLACASLSLLHASGLRSIRDVADLAQRASRPTRRRS